jgi:Tropinone reductase 1
MKFNEKVIFVTGASKGIGFATVSHFLKLGATVIAVARDVDLLINLDRVYAIPCDLSSEKERRLLIEEVKHQHQKIDVIVNNVGFNVRKSTLDFTTMDFRAIMELNALAAYDLCRGLFPLLKKAKGNIVNIGSVASERSLKTSTLAYAMSKGAMNELTRFLAVEWAADGIRVNSILPWYTATELVQSVLKDKQKLRAILEKTPLGRVAQPVEIAKAIAFLASEDASYITGVHLPVDGGFLAGS